MPNNYEEKNILFWNELAKVHSGVSDYDLANYNPDKYKLRDIETSSLGNVAGKRILHLQCHIGLDSFALEMMGAEVTAIDYSSTAIETANTIKQRFGLKTIFHCSSVYDLTSLDLGAFDIVFTSYGILVWLEHLDLWAKTIASHLKPGGDFLIIDEHPIARMFSNPHQDNTAFNIENLSLDIRDGEPVRANYKYSYANSDSQIENQEQYIWFHSISEIITSLISQNLIITKFEEFNMSFYKAFSQLELNENGWWCFTSETPSVPLMFLLCLKK
ncbi:Methyltransferase type 12 [Serratia proteamaculans]|uniref:class I SAM-dependent methyltransferase n=1 Tax=Serratia proteamaculans TaxID=28151 RepID=UPI0009F7FA30|nr:methyltransferase domain-containing protein [Serratia proteamaculans]SMB36278.1 Methyltransferase type 12 [Serratia proteamaculans]